MKLLIVTQVVDKEHPVLGFFHRWIEEFAVNCEEVSVICLQLGKHEFPQNVNVYSLGKEEGKGRFNYLIRFYALIWQLRHEYDRVFVHMNQLYIILGAPIWCVLGKPTGLWYMHGSVPLSLRLAKKLTSKIFTGSAESFRLKSDKVVVTGHGIDTVLFTPQALPKTIDLVTVGRITPSKNLTTLIDMFCELKQSDEATLTVVGVAVIENESQYEKVLKKKMIELGLESAVFFNGKVNQANLPAVLNQAKVFVTVAQNGSLDKAVLEAMACGLPVVSMASGTASLPLGTAQALTSREFTLEVKKVLESGMYFRGDYVDFVRQNHSLSSLIPKILNQF